MEVRRATPLKLIKLSVKQTGRLAPGSASTLIHSVIDQTFKNSSGIKLARSM
jgi:hypothetical protein